MSLRHSPNQADGGSNIGTLPAQSGLEVSPYQRGKYTDKEPANAETHHMHPQYYTEPTIEQTHGKALSQNPCGLGPLLYGCLVAALTAFVVGGALGGGLGSAIRSAKNCTSPTASTMSLSTATTTIPSSTLTSMTSTSSALYTNYIVVPPASVASLPYDCPNVSRIITQHNDKFDFVCNVDLPGNDIAALIAYSLADCCMACSGYNLQQGSRICIAILFNANMTNAVAHSNPPGGYNCLLKDGQASQVTIQSPAGALVIAGLLDL